MCKQGSEIKFCTCDEDALKEPFWRILRPSEDYSKPMVVGSFLPPWEIEKRKIKRSNHVTMVCDALNAGTAFDFNYDPQDGDLFELHTKEGDILMFTAEQCLAVTNDGPEFVIGWSYETAINLKNRRDLENLACGCVEEA